MKTKLNHFILIASLALTACSGTVRQDENSVTVKVQSPVENGPALVRLEVAGEKLIRVSATPEKKFADPQSLIIIPAQEQTPFTVSQNGDTVTVAEGNTFNDNISRVIERTIDEHIRAYIRIPNGYIY